MSTSGDSTAPPIDRHDAHTRALRFALRSAPEADLLAELDERLNDLASYEADLVAGIVAQGDVEQLRGGIAYERYHAELIVAELERRERAHHFGYRSAHLPIETELTGRFAAAKSVDCAEILRLETGQWGTRSGDRSRFHCPFHEDDTPSLVCYPGERGFYCFSCHRGGDAVKLVTELKSVGMLEALRLLESRALVERMPA
jgi:hypothetical protein